MTSRRKAVAVNLRIRPEMKRALELAAAKECRSQTSLLEWLLTRHCETLGIDIAGLADPSSDADSPVAGPSKKRSPRNAMPES
ncbi:MAG: hypothetical protein B7X93_09735 [Hydrogenophilales bacterium 17-61-9]|nr:MAG: hypothetical protein B7X93_09735 [Hydrogenophilales bacterium 17-61-9]